MYDGAPREKLYSTLAFYLTYFLIVGWVPAFAGMTIDVAGAVVDISHKAPHSQQPVADLSQINYNRPL